MSGDGARSKKVYISGPMTGLPQNNFPAFFAAAQKLRGLGMEVVNPAEISADSGGAWHECMRSDVRALCDCSGIVMLQGWEYSDGAQLELHVAHRLRLKVMFFGAEPLWSDEQEAQWQRAIARAA